MSKKTKRRLSVKRETLRALDPSDLSGVAGGDKARTAACAATYTCTRGDVPTFGCAPTLVDCSPY